MFRNYLTTALRNIARHRLYSIINIAGLAVGLACVLFITLFVRYELSYDTWIPGSENLYRVEVDFFPPGRPIIHSSNSQYMLPAAMRDEIPEVRAMTRLSDQRITMTAGNRQFLQQVSVVEPDFLRVIKLPLVSGDPATVLRQPQSIVLSQSVARKFFGNADPIGRTITVGRGDCEQNDAACNSAQVPLTVSGVMRDLPGNTQLVAEALMPNTSIVDRVTKQGKENWLGSTTYNYVRLSPGADPAAVVAKTIPIMDRHVDLSKLTNVKVRGSDIAKVRLVPFRDAHLSTDRYGAMTPPGSWTILYGMTVVGMLILLTACINYMNLATARATLRAREISLRKCMGATRRQLVVQFLGESVLMTLVALILALATVEALLPAFAHLVERPITFRYLQDWPIALAMLGLALVAGLASGIYPALVLSGFRPAATLRANAGGPGGSGALRTALVVLQFAVSIGLGISAVVIFSQIQYARALDLGFQHGNIVIVDGSRLSLEGRDSFEHALAAGPGVVGVARSNTLPFTGFTDATGLQVPGNPQLFTPNRDVVSPEFFALYKIKLLAGRMLSRQRSADVFQDIYQTGKIERNNGRNILVSAMTARQLGFGTQGAVGKTVIMGRARVRIVGVVSDVLFRGANSEILPRVYVYAGEAAGVFSVRVSGDMPAALAYIDHTWHSFLPNLFNSRSLLDDKFAKLYAADQRQGKIFGIFVAIAIFIAGLGLFGLAAFTAGRRTREIGVRKVFGARTRDVTFLLLWQFSIPVLIANLIAWPLAWYYLHGWLQGFAYRIPLNPLYFVGTGLAALLIAWATIFAHAWRVARANPINALRTE